MIVRTRGGGHREYRMPNPTSSDYIPTRSEYLAYGVPSSGEPLTLQKVAGIPAALNAIRLVAESTGSLPMRVYRGEGAEKEQVRDWRWDLFNKAPNDECSAFDFWQDIAACIETRGNAYVQKVKAGRARIEALYVIDPDMVKPKRDRRTGELVYMLRKAGRDIPMTRSEILHVRGPTLKGGDVGLTPLELAAETFGTTLARHRYEGSAYKNDATPAAVIETDEAPNGDKAKRILAVWRATHRGQAGDVGILQGGAKLKPYGLTMRDAQFVESNRYSVEDVARAFNMRPSQLGAGDPGEVEQDTKAFLSFGLGSRLNRIEAAFLADPDLFNDDAYPEFFSQNFIRLDAATEAEVRHKDVQSGVKLPDEARADIGLAPLPDGQGQIPQLTPVGGAPNPNLQNGDSEAARTLVQALIRAMHHNGNGSEPRPEITT